MDKIIIKNISIGDELLIGQVINTNAAWLGEHLSDAGFQLDSALTIGDSEKAILNAFKETIQYLKNNCRTFTNSVLILNGNHDTSVTPQDAIDFYQQTGAKDKSLRIYAGVNHFLMNDPKGKMIAGDVIGWMEDRLGDEVYEDAGI